MKSTLTYFRVAALAGVAMLALTQGASAALNVFACMPEWGALAREIVGPDSKVVVVVNPLENPENVELKPSIISDLRNADIIVCTGNGFEDAWLVPALERAQNPKVTKGKPGYFMASSGVKVLKDTAPKTSAPSGGHGGGATHDEGNPHIQGDPVRVRQIAIQLSKRMAQIDPAGADGYNERTKAFVTKLAALATELKQKAAPLKGIAVIPQHEDLVYLWDWLGINVVINIEPEPDVQPGPARLAEVLKVARSGKVKMVTYSAYLDPKPATYIASEAKLPLVKMPFTVGGTPEANDLLSLYSDSVQRLLDGLAGRDRP